MKNIRLDKYLADMGVGTRTEVKNLIKKGKVLVNDQVIREPSYKVSDSDKVNSEGLDISYECYEYLMLNKPAGAVTATQDKKDKTVMDYIVSKRHDLFPVGRLDKDTEGLLIITNDGDMAHSLLTPKKHVAKTYYVELEKDILEEYTREFENGLVLRDGTNTKPAILETIDSKRVYLTIYEGKFHQVKRMFEAVDNKVVYLKRMSMGSLKLDKELKLGEFRPLTKEEIDNLRRDINDN